MRQRSILSAPRPVPQGIPLSRPWGGGKAGPAPGASSEKRLLFIRHSPVTLTPPVQVNLRRNDTHQHDGIPTVSRERQRPGAPWPLLNSLQLWGKWRRQQDSGNPAPSQHTFRPISLPLSLLFWPCRQWLSSAKIASPAPSQPAPAGAVSRKAARAAGSPARRSGSPASAPPPPGHGCWRTAGPGQGSAWR